MNKKKGKSGQAASKLKKWKFEDEMSFVAPFFMERKTQDSVEISSNDEDSDDQPNPSENTVNDVNDTGGDAANAVANPTNTNTANTETLEGVEDSNNAKHNQTKRPLRTNIKKNKVQPMQTASAVLMAKLLDDQSKLEPQQGRDEMDRFFLNISETVKKFSPYLQALTKNKIFNLVSDMELQQLAPPAFSNNSNHKNALIPSPQSTTSSSSAILTPLHSPWHNQMHSTINYPVSSTPMPASPWDDQTQPIISNSSSNSTPLPTSAAWDDQTQITF